MVLLHQLNLYRDIQPLELVVAHVNHGLRPGESEKERELVQNEADRLGLPFEYGLFDVRSFAKVRGLSLQDGARRVRFRFFREVCARYGCQKIALGHNADDQVETVLLRLIRGSGLTGLRGMLAVRDGLIIRPLLETWRKEIESFALESGIPFFTDSSNLRQSYLRNRIRLGLIPLLEKEYQPRFREIVFRTALALREEDDCLEKSAEEAYGKIVRPEGEGLRFRFSEFQALPAALRRRVLRRMVAMLTERGSADEGGTPGVDKILQGLGCRGASLVLPFGEGLYVERRYDEVLLRKGRPEEASPFEMALTFPGRTLLEAVGKEIHLEALPKERMGQEGATSGSVVWLDFEKVSFPLKIRSFRPGDRFWPLGAPGMQKLKKFFIDHKVPRFERARVPLLVSGEEILWVVGYRMDERVKVTERTRSVLRAEVKSLFPLESSR